MNNKVKTSITLNKEDYEFIRSEPVNLSKLLQITIKRLREQKDDVVVPGEDK